MNLVADVARILVRHVDAPGTSVGEEAVTTTYEHYPDNSRHVAVI